MPNPKEVFDNYQLHWNFITVNSDDKFEGQYFDRKEVPSIGANGQVGKNEFKRFKTEESFRLNNDIWFDLPDF